jgi:hypothetical protein
MALGLEVQGSLAGSAQSTQFRSHLHDGSFLQAHDRESKALCLCFINEERATLWQHHVNVRRIVGPSNRNLHPVDNPKSDLHAHGNAHTTMGEPHE